MALTANHPITPRRRAQVMNRFDLISAHGARLHHDEAVIGGIGYSNFDLWAAGRRPQNFYMLGSMGLAVPIALGVALAQPQRRVIALEGDGSMLMQLGSLTTIAAQRPTQPGDRAVGQRHLPDHRRADRGIGAGRRSRRDRARGAGLAQSAWAADEGDFEEQIDPRADRGRSLGDRLPHRHATSRADTTERDPALIRDRFMRGLGVKQ